MRILQIVLIAAGIAVGACGAVLLLDDPPVVLVRIAVWAAAGVILHDFVFAPLCVALGFAGRRLLPAPWRTPVAVAALCSVVLALLAIPVYDKPGARPDNLTVLDRDYVSGLWIALAVVWVCVPLYLLAARRLPVRQDQVVDGQRADDVERQPPPV
ncbi:hypothetical protein MJO55_03690 [Mycolicibacterium rufum]|uniref:Lipoprotein n=1 Tax=Mycolicibacterium rufum TaxID=318424 RepID=A0A9X2YGR4_9MYCO|nr:hypothetical protein [Mycolicibacterium rufum]KGI66749.1 hypothetical protein EU78_03875 [Mycolicibacterium rufum]MCV7072381.1 hypothetical protein [Mycolicibacterium rufum]ULP37552.1 hypothetical protein MJO55_03690 [Mycolicibacterium rufum]